AAGSGQEAEGIAEPVRSYQEMTEHGNPALAVSEPWSARHEDAVRRVVKNADVEQGQNCGASLPGEVAFRCKPPGCIDGDGSIQSVVVRQRLAGTGYTKRVRTEYIHAVVIA